MQRDLRLRLCPFGTELSDSGHGQPVGQQETAVFGEGPHLPVSLANEATRPCDATAVVRPLGLELEQGERELFEQYCLKVTPCPRRFVHDWSLCPFGHVGEKAKRRDPLTHTYTGIACVSMKQDGTCGMGDACPHAHSDWEYWLHPSRYHTAICKQGANCQRTFCFFAHDVTKLRRLAPGLGGGGLRAPAPAPAPLAGNLQHTASSMLSTERPQSSGCLPAGSCLLAGPVLGGSCVQRQGGSGGMDVYGTGVFQLGGGASVEAAHTPESVKLESSHGALAVAACPAPASGVLDAQDRDARAVVQAVAQGRMDTAQAVLVLQALLVNQTPQ